MNFKELEELLPNGFHDATILRFALDAQTNSLQMRISIHISDPDDSDSERYGTIDINANEVSLFFLEPPDPRYPFLLKKNGIATSGDFTFTLGGSKHISTSAREVLNKVPQATSIYRFFLENWNSFLYLAAEGVSYQWV